MTKHDKPKKPSLEFLSMVNIMLRRAEAETGESLVGWLESLEELDDTMQTDAYDDRSLRKIVSKLIKKYYPEDRPELNPADYLDEESVPQVDETRDVDSIPEGEVIADEAKPLDQPSDPPGGSELPPEADDDDEMPAVEKLD